MLRKQAKNIENKQINKEKNNMVGVVHGWDLIGLEMFSGWNHFSFR